MIETLEDWNARLIACGCCPMPGCAAPAIEGQSKQASLSGIIGHSGILFVDVEYTAERNYSATTTGSNSSGVGQYSYTYTQTVTITDTASRKVNFSEGLIGGHESKNRSQERTEERTSFSGGSPYTVSENTTDVYTAAFNAANPSILTGTRVRSSSNPGMFHPPASPTSTTSAYSRANDLGSGLSFSTLDPANLYFKDRLHAINPFWAGEWDFIRATWTNPYDVPGAIAKLTTDLSGVSFVADNFKASMLTAVISSFETGEKVKSALMRLARVRFQIPITHLGTYFKITYDVAEFPTVGAASFVSQDNVVEWTGPGTGLQSDPSWLTPWVEISPPTVPGQRRIVNVRYTCYHGAKFGVKPQVTGETLKY